MKGLVTALRTLTILPVPGKEAEKFTSSLYFFPVAGAVIGRALYEGTITIEAALEAAREV